MGSDGRPHAGAGIGRRSMQAADLVEIGSIHIDPNAMLSKYHAIDSDALLGGRIDPNNEETIQAIKLFENIPAISRNVVLSPTMRHAAFNVATVI